MRWPACKAAQRDSLCLPDSAQLTPCSCRHVLQFAHLQQKRFARSVHRERRTAGCAALWAGRSPCRRAAAGSAMGSVAGIVSEDGHLLGWVHRQVFLSFPRLSSSRYHSLLLVWNSQDAVRQFRAAACHVHSAQRGSQAVVHLLLQDHHLVAQSRLVWALAFPARHAGLLRLFSFLLFPSTSHLSFAWRVLVFFSCFAMQLQPRLDRSLGWRTGCDCVSWIHQLARRKFPCQIR